MVMRPVFKSAILEYSSSSLVPLHSSLSAKFYTFSKYFANFYYLNHGITTLDKWELII